MALSSVVRARSGAVVAGVAIALGAASVAAFAAGRPGAPPASSVPADDPSGSSTPSPGGGASEEPGVGPDAKGSAAFGLCNAWANHHKHADGKERAAGSVAMRNLAEAAGGEDKVEAYCAKVPHPGRGVGPDGKHGAPDKDKDKASGGAEEDDKAGEQKGKAPKEPGKAGRSGKDKTAQSPSGSPSPTASPSASPTASLSPSGS